MRTHPIGTGPFKFVEFKPNELIRVSRNPDYWKKDRPHLDGIEYTIIPSISTRILGFVAGKFDTVTGVTVPLLKDVKSQAPQAICEVAPKNRAVARKIMENLGYGPDKRLATKVSIRNIVPTRDPAVILIDQLKEIYIDGELETIDTTQWYPKVMRRDFTVGMVVSENGLDDPDQQFYENYVCGADRNYAGYCKPQLDEL